MEFNLNSIKSIILNKDDFSCILYKIILKFTHRNTLEKNMEEKISKFFEKNHINIEDIKYVLRDDKKTNIYLNNKVVSTFIPMKNFTNELISYGFIDINKGILVSKKMIDHVDGFIYYLTDGTNYEGRKRTVGAHKHINEMIKIKGEVLSGIDIFNRFSVLDHMPAGFCVIELVFDKQGNGIDFIFRYCNKEMERVEGKDLQEMLNHSFYKVFPNADKKWLAVYSKVAITGESDSFVDYSPEIKKDLLFKCFQPMQGFCACLITPVEDIHELISQK